MLRSARAAVESMHADMSGLSVRDLRDLLNDQRNVMLVTFGGCGGDDLINEIDRCEWTHPAMTPAVRNLHITTRHINSLAILNRS